MITEKQKQIIKLLLTNKEGYNVNQIARILNISVSWTHETLKTLEREGILKSARLGNAVFFKLNWEEPKTEKICDFILLDTKEQQTTQIHQEQEKEEQKPTKEFYDHTNHQSFYASQTAQFKGYSANVPHSQGNIDSPYRQAVASSQSFDQTGYRITPVGEQGVNNVLFSYANSGALGPTSGGYAGSGVKVSSSPVPADSLGSRISSNVSGFTMVQHTSAHKTMMAGCRYCSAENL